MKSKIALEQDIMTMVAKIHREYPELSKYITEIPLKSTETDEAMIKNLEDYYCSLEEIVAKYAQTHQGIRDKKGGK